MRLKIREQRFQIRIAGVAFLAFASWRGARPISVTRLRPAVIFRHVLVWKVLELCFMDSLLMEPNLNVRAQSAVELVSTEKLTAV